MSSLKRPFLDVCRATAQSRCQLSTSSIRFNPDGSERAPPPRQRQTGRPPNIQRTAFANPRIIQFPGLKPKVPDIDGNSEERALSQGSIEGTLIRNSDRRRADAQVSKIQRVNDMKETADMEKFQFRRFKEGDIYTPKDINGRSIGDYRPRPRAPNRDVLDMLSIDPREEYKNPAFLSAFVTPLGRIKHRRDTGLRGTNQRRAAKAVRRAISMGWLPSSHAHPEILRRVPR